MSLSLQDYADQAVDAGAAPVSPQTPYGRAPQAPKKKRLKKEPTAPREIFLRPIYLCPELGRLSCRPGAYDAYELPSLYAGGTRKPYRFSEGG